MGTTLSAMKCNGCRQCLYICILVSITVSDYVLSSMYSDLSLVPVISEVQSYITSWSFQYLSNLVYQSL